MKLSKEGNKGGRKKERKEGRKVIEGRGICFEGRKEGRKVIGGRKVFERKKK